MTQECIDEQDFEQLNEFQMALLDEIHNTVFVINDIVADGKKAYRAHIEKIYDTIKQGFEKKQFREFPVKFKFNNDDARTYILQLRHYLTNLMFWGPFVRLGLEEELNEEHIVDCSLISTDFIKSYLDYKLIMPYREEFSNKKMNQVIADMLYNLSRISVDFTLLMGLSLNLETFIDVANRNKRFDEILHTQLDPDQQPKDIEDFLDKLEKEEIDILSNDPKGNFLQPILKSGSGIKHKQLRELTGAGGLKPDLFDNTMPVPITGNFIVGGLGSIANYYVDSAAARKAVVMNKTVMGTSGHFARKVMLIATDSKLRNDELECNTVNTICYHIKTKDHLRRLRGRNMVVSPSKTYTIKGNEEHLIGKSIYVYSPITCASHEGICKKCYGGLYYTNRDLFSVGAFAAAKTTNPISQSVLSTKHLLTTISDRIDFNDEFYEFFSLVSNEVIINTSSDAQDITKFTLCIDENDLQSIAEFDETDYNKYVSCFYLKKKKSRDHMIKIEELEGKELYLSPALIDLIKRGKTNEGMIEIDLSKIDESEKLFSIIVNNNELTKPLYAIMAVLDRKGNLGCKTISEICQKLVDLFITSHINLDAVHAELLVKPLIRDRENVLKFPKFNTYKAPESYQILSVSTALEKNPSVLVSLSFQALGRQLSSPTTYEKVGTSYLDPFFREKL